MPDKITVKGQKELVQALAQVSTRVGSALAAAIRDGLTPGIPAMRAAVQAAVTGGEETTNHWTTSETDFREYTTKSGKKKRSLSSGELIRAVKANGKYAGKAKIRRQFAIDGSLAVVGRTGMLAKSIAVKAKAKRAKKVGNKRISQNAATGWLGPSNIEMVAVSKWTGKPQVVKPTRYAHLVNNPHKIVIRGRSYGMSKGRNFMAPVLAAHAAAIEQRIAHRLRLEVASATKGIRNG